MALSELTVCAEVLVFVDTTTPRLQEDSITGFEITSGVFVEQQHLCLLHPGGPDAEWSPFVAHIICPQNPPTVHFPICKQQPAPQTAPPVMS